MKKAEDVTIALRRVRVAAGATEGVPTFFFSVGRGKGTCKRLSYLPNMNFPLLPPLAVGFREGVVDTPLLEAMRSAAYCPGFTLLDKNSVESK